MRGTGELSLVLYRRDLLKKLCRRVQSPDDLAPFIEGMSQIVRQTGTVGLAAPQIGVDLQLVILAAPSGEIDVLVNPEIANLAGKDLVASESCLSLPPTDQATARVWRSEIVHVRTGTVEDPNAAKIVIYKGALARTVQHEIDHLYGIFFIDRCQTLARCIVLRRFEQYLQRQEVGRRAEFAAHPAMRFAS